MIFMSGARGARTLNLMLAKHLRSRCAIAPYKRETRLKNPHCYSQTKVLLITHYPTLAV